MGKTILHIDLNAFFVRCEEIRNPSLEGKPVIIGHEGRCGIVSTCSYKAREYGVRSGMPTFKAKQLCPQAIIVSDSRNSYKYYKEMSKSFFNIVKRYSKLIEPMSIDECFVDITEQIKNVKNPLAYIKEIQDTIYKETKLKCSIGVAATKFLAKMASDMKKPMGITVIRRKDVRKMLDPLPIGDFFGIGKKSAPRFIAAGYKTIGDLAKLVNESPEEASKFLGKFYSTIKDWINGYGSDVVDVEPFDPKSVGHSKTLMADTNNYDELADEIKEISKEVSEDAKRIDKIGYSVQIVLKNDEFKTTNASKRLERPTNDYEVIVSTALSLLDKKYNPEQNIRLVGVTLQQLIVPEEALIQLSIFDDPKQVEEECATKLLIADLNRKTKKETFKTMRDYLTDKKYGN